MPRSLTVTKSLSVLASAAVCALALGACGTVRSDPTKGKVLFIQKCGSCHTLAEAATAGVQGPDLDDAFAAARAAGESPAVIAGVVKSQVGHPRPIGPNPATSMPAGLASGTELDDIAAYVASVAGVPGIGPPKVAGGPGAQVFANNGCGGCHTLKAAGTGGTVGPNLDQYLPGQSSNTILQHIVNPSKNAPQGFPTGVMPSNFGQAIPPAMLKQLVDYLISATSGSKPKH